MHIVDTKDIPMLPLVLKKRVPACFFLKLDLANSCNTTDIEKKIAIDFVVKKCVTNVKRSLFFSDAY